MNIYGYFFLVLFICFYGSITFFNHTHIVNGDTIVHSHPYKADKEGNPTHQHTSNGYLLIHVIRNFTAALSFFYLPGIPFFFLNKVYHRRKLPFIQPIRVIPNSLRGPPSVIHFF
jgi:hypothetical protein